MKKILTLLMITFLTGCIVPSKTFYINTEHLRKKDCSILYKDLDSWTCTITHVDNVPTNFIPGNPYENLFMAYRTLLRLRPGNHSIKYSYSYEIYLMNDIFNNMSEETKSRFAKTYSFDKEGVINFNFEKGEKYTLIVINETSRLNGQQHHPNDWESVCNKYISVSIR